MKLEIELEPFAVYKIVFVVFKCAFAVILVKVD